MTLEKLLKNRIASFAAKAKDNAANEMYDTAFSFMERAKEDEVLLDILAKNCEVVREREIDIPKSRLIRVDEVGGKFGLNESNEPKITINGEKLLESESMTDISDKERAEKIISDFGAIKDPEIRNDLLKELSGKKT